VTESGLSYLRVKFQLLLNYCMNVSYYLLLKSQGKPIENHGVIQHLVHTRVLLSRLKPLDKKLKYQLNNLLSMDKSQVKKGRAAVQNRANLSDFLSTETSTKELKMDPNALYEAPKFLPTTMNTKKNMMDKERKKERARDSELMDYLVDEFSEAPIQRSSQGFDQGLSRAEMRMEAAKDKFEDEQFRPMYFHDAKEIGSKKRWVIDGQNPFSKIEDDYGDFEDLEEEMNEETIKEHKRSKLNRILGVMDEEDEGENENEEEEEDSADKILKKYQPRERNSTSFDIVQLQETNAKSKGGRRVMKQLVPKPKKPKAAERAKMTGKKRKANQFFKDEKEGDRREINYAIKRNKTVEEVRKRKKKRLIPRVQNREAYAEKMEERERQIGAPRTEGDGYEGEKRGITKNVTRSRLYQD